MSTSADIAIPELLEVQDVPTSLAADQGFVNHPRWNLVIAVLTWMASVIMLVVPQFLAIPYILLRYRGLQPTAETLLADKKFILIMIVGVLPMHVYTLIIVWLVATRCGERSIVDALGLRWSGKFTLVRSIGLALSLYVAALLLTKVFGGQDTALDQLVKSSRAAALTIAFLAVVTAPIVEESIYRGILYPAIARISSARAAIIVVTILFAAVHVPQYAPNIAIIASITLLSVVLTILRAWTGRLLPCIAVHLAFNGIQSIIIVFEPYLRTAVENMRHTRGTGSIVQLLIHFL